MKTALAGWVLGVATIIPVASSIADDDAALRAAVNHFMSNKDASVVLRGDYFRAVSIAYADFQRGHGSQHKKYEYDMVVEQASDFYIVRLFPSLRNLGVGPDVFGGEWTYKIDRRSFAIISKTASK